MSSIIPSTPDSAKDRNIVAMATPSEADADTSGVHPGDHQVGFRHPPLHTRFKPGQSGYPQGRPKDRLNNKTIIKQLMNTKVTVQDGEKERQLPLLAANFWTHAVAGAKGDARSSGLAFNLVEKLGLLDDREDKIANQSTALPANKPRPGDRLLENIERHLVTDRDMIELSHLAEFVDLGGDVTALSTADFERLKHIVNKGRGKDITPSDAPRRDETP